MKKKLSELFPCCNNEKFWDADDKSNHGYCLRIDKVFNLVTKRNYWNKPTLQTMENALKNLRDLYCYPGIKIAMPKIGCGLDKLRWDDVSALIKKVFKDKDIEILVCYQ